MPPPFTRVPPAFCSLSHETGTTYPIYLDIPAVPGPWPAVLLMDGDYIFDAAVAAVRELRATGDVPPTLLVAVGYGAGFGAADNHRARDYTPDTSDLEPESGGADAFLAYLTDTLWPELARRYPLREDARVLGGHSLGSLLVLHALFQPQPFFSLALASAPSIWWADRAILARIAQFRDTHSSLPGTLYLGVGTEDSASMTGDLALLEQQLAARPFTGLRIVSERYPDRDHYNAPPDALRAGLRALLGTTTALPRPQ